MEALSELDRIIVEESMRREAADKMQAHAEAGQAAISEARAKLQASGSAVSEADVAGAKAARARAADEFAQVCRAWSVVALLLLSSRISL